jgi:hypothetical protein
MNSFALGQRIAKNRHRSAATPGAALGVQTGLRCFCDQVKLPAAQYDVQVLVRFLSDQRRGPGHAEEVPLEEKPEAWHVRGPGEQVAVVRAWQPLPQDGD